MKSKQTLCVGKQNFIKAVSDINGKFWCPPNLLEGLLRVWPNDVLIEVESTPKKKSREIKEISKLNNNIGVKLSSTVRGQRELIREMRNKINELTDTINLLIKNK